MIRPKRKCRFPNCRKKVTSGYCKDHRHHLNTFATTASDPWYNHKIWKGNPNRPLGKRGGLREAQLMREPFCRTCMQRGVVNDVTSKGKGVVDHITPFRSAPTEAMQWRLFVDPDNHQSLCRDCNKAKTAEDSKAARRAGKITG